MNNTKSHLINFSVIIFLWTLVSFSVYPIYIAISGTIFDYHTPAYSIIIFLFSTIVVYTISSKMDLIKFLLENQAKILGIICIIIALGEIGTIIFQYKWGFDETSAMAKDTYSHSHNFDDVINPDIISVVKYIINPLFCAILFLGKLNLPNGDKGIDKKRIFTIFIAIVLCLFSLVFSVKNFKSVFYLWPDMRLSFMFSLLLIVAIFSQLIKKP